MRNYKKKTNQNSWSEESMRAAIRAVRTNEFTQNAAARRYDVPLATLNRRIRSGKGEVEGSKKKLGRFKTIFTLEQENELSEHILDLEKKFFGISTYELRSLAYQYAEQNGIEHNFNGQTKLAGKDWMYGFLKRHSQLSLRTPENTSAARASGFNRVSVNAFFNLLGSLIDKYAFPPSRIYNCDETGITTVPNKPTKIFSLKGKKQVGCYTSAERGTTVTAEICFSATGHYIPPLLVIPRVRRNPIYEIGLPAESVVAYHNSGWMQSDIFSDIWFPHFIHHTHPSEDSPVLLILDGHATHVKNIKLIEQAREKHVIILSIPPHTSHRLQPLDVAFMFPLSNYYTQELKIWQRNKPNKIIELSDVGQIFSRAYVKAATLSNAQNGFKTSGIFPFNPNKFTDDLFAPSELTEREQEVCHEHIDNEQEEPDEHTEREQEESGKHTEGEQDEPSKHTEREENPNKKRKSSTNPSKNTIDSQDIAPGCSHWNVSSLSISNNKTPLQADQEKTPPQGQKLDLMCNNHNDKTISTLISPQNILPIPKVTPKQTTKGPRRKGKTAIITSSPYLEELKESKRKQEKPNPKQIKKIKRNLDIDLPVKTSKKLKRNDVELSDSEESNDIQENMICQDESDNSNFIDHSDDEIIQSEKKLSLVDKEIEVNEFVLVALQDEKTKNIKKYAAQVIDIRPQEQINSYTVKFMRNYRGHNDIFVFPEVEDQSVIFRTEIEGVLYKMDILRYGKIKFN